MSDTSTSPVDIASAKSSSPFTIAVMQPYFIPYAGYFRLFAASELFVIYDCVQFPRRGWVHRNQLIDQYGAKHWLTLPLEKAPQNVLIRDLCFVSDAPAVLSKGLRRFRFASSDRHVLEILDTLRDVQGNPVDYIESLLHQIAVYLGLRWNVIRSSTLNVPPNVRGQPRILEIARRLGARRYVNSPGGRDLYDPVAFRNAGIELRFLPVYVGSTASIMSRLVNEHRDDLLQDILGFQNEGGFPA
jgi:hypothetical protein